MQSKPPTVRRMIFLLAASTWAGCGPSRTAPKETDVSVIPPDVVASFRREQPNAVIVKAGEDSDHNWRLKTSSPRRVKKVYVYSPQGDLLKKY